MSMHRHMVHIAVGKTTVGNTSMGCPYATLYRHSIL